MLSAFPPLLRPLQVQEEAKQRKTRGCHLTVYSKWSVFHMRLEKKILPLNTCVYLYPSCFLHGVLHSNPRAPSLTYRETHYAVECERDWKVRPRKVRRLVPHHTASWGPAESGPTFGVFSTFGCLSYKAIVYHPARDLLEHWKSWQDFAGFRGLPLS